MLGVFQDEIKQLLVSTGLDAGNLKILICAALSFPFSYIFKRLPDNNYRLKNLFNIGVSSFYIIGILNEWSGLWNLLFSALGCYFITRYVKTSTMPWINFIFLMSHLAYNHLKAQFFGQTAPDDVDITGAQMVMVMKLTAFGWNIYDGKQSLLSLSDYAKERKILKHPNILPYLGYVFFYASVLTGPAFDYADYDKFIHSTLFDDVPQDKRPGARKRRIPRSGKPALNKLLRGIFWAFLFVNSSKYLSLDYILNGQLFQEHNFIYRIFYMWGLGFTYRLKYYTIWSIAEGACILCGIGYNGYDSDTDSFKWDRVQNINEWAFETGQNVRACLEAWNMNTNKWLKNYVYVRIAKKGQKPGFKSTLFTFSTSAFWHGTCPGYYLTFIVGAFLQTLGKIYRRNFRPIFMEADGKTPKPTKVFYDIISYIITQLAFGYAVQPFVILDFGKSIYCWFTVYFWLHGIIGLTFFVFRGPYKKQVTQFLQRYHASAVIQEQKKKTSEPELTTDKNVEKNANEVAPVPKVIDKEQEVPTFGLPSIEDLEQYDKEEVQRELQEIGESWKSFRARRGSLKDDDFEGLREAYANFTAEMNDIFQHAKEDADPKKTE
ncbi:lysophospholipid acyltransferase [Scheffersomyces spartinae]|uniref:Lysophospholipid acyltransferase n=1 Tax=Scheffersomyces spartinae TaxID=45513 RepID=A0A9P7V7P7_9ASCO|nr:lysophospholipid acyltransferase [Scheffersomyces spartinae]KAG7192757.1 lysophospholipid acyltransferase [Scheffersomyces spartinae]